jgi:hypothetical protein
MSPKVRRTITIRLRKPVDITLATVSSDSEPGKTHRIALDRHNAVFCTCKGWRYNGHSCPHIRAFRERLVSASEKLFS